MAISGISNNTPWWTRIERKICDALPAYDVKSKWFSDTVKPEKRLNQTISSPEKRVIEGLAALAIQPAIDARNRNVDEKTRKVSKARITAKIIVGMTTGYLVRKGCIKGIERLS